MNTIQKTLTPSNDLCIKFTEDELLQLGVNPGDKFSVNLKDDGSVFLEKLVPLDIDLDEFDIETLKKLVAESIESDRPVGDIMREALSKYIDHHHTDDVDEAYEF